MQFSPVFCLFVCVFFFFGGGGGGVGKGVDKVNRAAVRQVSASETGERLDTFIAEPSAHCQLCLE